MQLGIGQEIFPITHYQLPITDLHRYDKSLNGHDITTYKYNFSISACISVFTRSNARLTALNIANIEAVTILE